VRSEADETIPKIPWRLLGAFNRTDAGAVPDAASAVPAILAEGSLPKSGGDAPAARIESRRRRGELPALCRYRYFSLRFHGLGCSSACADFSLGRLPQHEHSRLDGDALTLIGVSQISYVSEFRARRLSHAHRWPTRPHCQNLFLCEISGCDLRCGHLASRDSSWPHIAANRAFKAQCRRHSRRLRRSGGRRDRLHHDHHHCRRRPARCTARRLRKPSDRSEAEAAWTVRLWPRARCVNETWKLAKARARHRLESPGYPSQGKSSGLGSRTQVQVVDRSTGHGRYDQTLWFGVLRPPR
jgi:hypothetical protein